MFPLLLVQVALPLALVGWLWQRPLHSRVGLAVQITATGLVICALGLIGLWLVPPWWTPLLYAVLFVMAAVSTLGTIRPLLFPQRSEWISAAAMLMLGIHAATQIVAARSAATSPEVPVVDVAFPLKGQSYYVANGGAGTILSSHAKTLARATPRQRAYYGQSYGVDIVAINRFGVMSHGIRPRAPRRYLIFGESVHAPCSGVVMHVLDDQPDMPVPEVDYSPLPGNHVLLRCGKAEILLAHLLAGSVKVRTGQFVKQGEILGEVGNSGNTTFPHLHIHAQRPGTASEPFSGKPLQVRFGGRYLIRGDRL